MSFCSWFKDEEYRDNFDPGLYVCVECGYELFSSQAKYEHHTPWPAFTKTVHKDSVSKVPEEGRPGALKVSCGKCGNGLGHEFLKDGPDGKMSRFWIFSHSLKFIPKTEGGQILNGSAEANGNSWDRDGTCKLPSSSSQKKEECRLV